jgi:REP element-mobilizing transposase RayT
MVRRKVRFLEGHYYHVYNRGANKEKIFRDGENYRFLLSWVKRYSIQFEISVIAYCLLPNHYHFLLRQDGLESISIFIQRIFNRYTKAFNKIHQRTGTLFEGPYKAIGIDNNEYLIHLCRYIHRNPLEAGLITDLLDWPYSNYLEWVGVRSGTLIDQQFVLEHFVNVEEYKRFVLDYFPSDRINQRIQGLSLED